MKSGIARRCALLLLALCLSPACTIVSVDSRSGPPGLRADGLVDGHAVFGFRDEDHVLHLDLFDGTSPGAIGELVIWRLARLEVGLAGLAIGLGPVDLALGTLFYDPRMPSFVRHETKKPHDHHPEDGEDPQATRDDDAEPDDAEAPAEPITPVDEPR